MSETFDGEIIRRQFAAEIEPSGDGRTLEMRVVPYGVVARVSDRPGEFYDEVWEPGVFDKQLGAPNRVDVLVNFEHEPGIRGVVGRGTELRSSDGLDLVARMLSGHDADKALELVNENVLTGVSLEAIPLKSVRENGVVRRLKARLVNVALCRMPAFPEAKVLAVREAGDEPEPEPEPEPDPTPDEPEDEAAKRQIQVEIYGDVTGDEVVQKMREGLFKINEAKHYIVGEARSEKTSDLAAEALKQVGYEPWSQRTADEVLQRIGYEQLVIRAVTRKPWDGSAARFTDEQYQRSCLIDRGGDAPVKERCSLPVLEPDGDLNANALGAAAARLNQTQASPEQKATAARKLRRYYSQAGMPPPPSVMAMAGR